MKLGALVYGNSNGPMKKVEMAILRFLSVNFNIRRVFWYLNCPMDRFCFRPFKNVKHVLKNRKKFVYTF